MTEPRSFCWYELVTADAPAATRFYADVVGWDAQPTTLPGIAYTTMGSGAHRTAGIMTMPDEMKATGQPGGWLGYIGVADADAASEALVAAGGTVHRPAQDIPEVGRFAIVADPQGAVFTLFQPFGEATAAPAPMTPGTVGWHELYADDWEAAFAFYAALFGWTKDQPIPMGPMGTYQLFAAGGPPAGGMMDRGDFVPKAVWGFYFVVQSLDAAAERVTAGGGRIVNGPMEVPGGAWIVNALDPQGIAFSLVAAHR